jgi:hypothetical protein
VVSVLASSLLEQVPWFAIFGLLVAVGTLLFLRRQTQIGARDDAREEALDLAKVRAQVITDLKKKVDDVVYENKREQEKYAEKIEMLEKVIEHVRTESAETQRLLAVGFRGALIKVLEHLEADPQETERAIEFLRDALNGDAPPPPGRLRRRRAA